MNLFLIFICSVIVSVLARPHVSLGYHYNGDYDSGSNFLVPPEAPASYFPTASVLDDTLTPESYDSGAILSSSGLGNYMAGVSSASSASSSLSSSPGFTGISSASAASASSFANTGNLGGAEFNSQISDSAFSTIDSQNSAIHGKSGSGYENDQSLTMGISQEYLGTDIATDQQYATQDQQQPPIITKQFYFHNAPEDHGNSEIVRHVTIGRPTKNYQVVFINAPSSTSTKAKIVANLAPTEERTAIYVLSKKGHPLDISTDVIAPAPNGRHKPDVFFIKYKTPQEAIYAQHVIQDQYDKLGYSSGTSIKSGPSVQSVAASVSSQDSSQVIDFPVGFNQKHHSENKVTQAINLPAVYRRRRYNSYNA